MLHPAPRLGWLGAGVDFEVRFRGRFRGASASWLCRNVAQVVAHWNMNSVSLLNCASNWLAGIGRPNR